MQGNRKLIVIAVILLGSYALFELLNPWGSHLPYFFALYLFTFAVFGVATLFLFRGDFDDAPAALIFVPALLFRLVIFWSPPSLSEDFYRYVWDGKVQNAGNGPYDYAPEAKQLLLLHDEHWEMINHKEFKTPYPAAAETFFRFFAAISTRPHVFKGFIALFDILLLEVLRRLLVAEQRKPAWLLLYAWHPLSVLEFSGSGHMDILGIALLFASYLFLRGKRVLLSGFTYAWAVLTKYLPVLLLPWFWKQGKWKFLLAVIVVSALLIAQYYTPDLRMLTGVMSYYKKWWFNDSLFGILRSLLGGAEPAKLTGMACTVLALGFCFGADLPFYRSAVILFGCVLLFSPVVHPWYLCWVLPFLVFHPNKPWLFLTGWIVLAYWVRYLFPSGVWQPVLWLKLLIYVPFYIWLIIDAALSLRRPKVVEEV